MSRGKEIMDILRNMSEQICKNTQYNLNINGIELVHLQMGLKALKEKYTNGLSDKEFQEIKQLQEKLDSADFV